MTLHFSLGYLLWYLSWLATLRGLCSLGCLIVKRKSGDFDTLKRAREREKTANRLTEFASLVLIAMFYGHHLGYSDRNAELISNQHELLGMSILREYPAGNYDAVTETGTSFPFNPCPDSPRLAVGMYRMVKWEQRNGCKFVTYWLPKPDPTTGAIADVR